MLIHFAAQRFQPVYIDFQMSGNDETPYSPEYPLAHAVAAGFAVAAAASPLGPVAIPVALGAALVSFIGGKHKQATQADEPSVIAEEEEEGPSDADHGLKPNFVKFVVVTDQSTPVDHFLPGCVAKPLLDQQKDAIHLYSGNSVYQQMNQALRKDDQTGLKTYGSLINLTMQPFSFAAMQRPGSLLTPYVGTVWRGCQLPEFDRKKYSTRWAMLSFGKAFLFVHLQNIDRCFWRQFQV